MEACQEKREGRDMNKIIQSDCEGCNTTAGRMACYYHSGMKIPFNDYFKRCKNGHPVENWYKYCPECGEKI